MDHSYTESDIEAFSRDFEGHYFDRKSELLSGTSIEDVDREAVDIYRRTLGTDVDDEKLLRSIGVLKDGHLTNAGMMLFGENVRIVLPQARFRVLKIDGTEIGHGEKLRIVKDRTFEGPFVKTIPAARDFIASQLREYQFQDHKTMKFRTVSEYPEYPWFEGLVNAITHRDYSIYGEYIRVYIFNDRMLIQSPGKLPGAVTLENIRHKRFSRNPTIARVFTAFDWVRELNEGVDKIYQEMDDAGLPEPEYENDDDYYLKLTLRNSLEERVPRLRDVGNVGNVGNNVGNVGSEFGSTAARVLRLIKDDSKISAQGIADTLGMSKRHVERVIATLRDEGILIREGGTRGSWRIASTDIRGERERLSEDGLS